MKIVLSWCSLFVLLLAGGRSFAQNSIFMGKITDEHGKPVTGARIMVSYARDIVAETMSDNDGAYYTKLLEPGYYLIDVYADKIRHKSKRIELKPRQKVKWYYNLQLVGDKVEVTTTSKDPFIAAKLSKIEKEPVLSDFGTGRSNIFITDSKGRVTRKSMPRYVDDRPGIR